MGLQPLEPLDCTDCTQCCRYIYFVVDMRGKSDRELRENLDYHEKHGCRVRLYQGSQYLIIVPSVCQYLTDNGCSIHDSVQPAICRRYDCRTDRWLPKGGNYNK